MKIKKIKNSRIKSIYRRINILYDKSNPKWNYVKGKAELRWWKGDQKVSEPGSELGPESLFPWGV
jgi:hypothetical protein